MGGSPPHLRGKLCILAFRHFKARITPAPAGKTWNSCRFVLAGWDHPRTCGENVRRVSSDFNRRGSPPHLRGKLPTRSLSSKALRITPAPAGKTVWRASARETSQDHPRTCGENGENYEKDYRFSGSPPHLRGKLALNNLYRLLAGITPAPAGKTNIETCENCECRDHPRTCGENNCASVSLT